MELNNTYLQFCLAFRGSLTQVPARKLGKLMRIFVSCLKDPRIIHHVTFAFYVLSSSLFINHYTMYMYVICITNIVVKKATNRTNKNVVKSEN